MPDCDLTIDTARFRGDRSLRALIWGGVLILLTGLAPRPFRQVGNSADFWYTKLNWSHCADVVVAGDSRTYRGLSPRHMSETLRERRIRNFGFSGTGFSEAYLSAIERVIDPDCEQPTIVLGITPFALTEPATRENQFIELSSSNTSINIVKAKYLGGLTQFFQPRSLGFGRLPWQGIQRDCDEFFPDGWVATTRAAQAPTRMLPSFREYFASHQVDHEVVASLLDRVSRWSQRGIRVYGFRPPTSEATCAIEDGLGQFDETDFRRRFANAGGTWLQVDPSGMNSYDGSHLDRSSAVQLSHYLANCIQQVETRDLAERPVQDRHVR